MIIRAFIFLGFACAGAWFSWQWWEERQAFVFVVDARIASDMVTLSAPEPARLVRLDVGTGDRVERGQTMAQLDTREIELQIEEVARDVAQLETERKRLLSMRQLVLAQVNSAGEMARAEVEVAAAEHRAQATMLTRSRDDLARAEQLFSTKVISSQGVEQARTVFENATERASKANAAIVAAQASLKATQAERAQLAVLDADAAVLTAQMETLAVRAQQLSVKRDDRRIAIEFDGVVDRTFVEEGEYLREGTRILMLHDPANVWVAANVKETELHRFAPGASVSVVVDAFPDRVLTGKVSWIGPSANSQFALIPNPTPSGNFTKVTQRVPVRIDFASALDWVRPGMMVEVAIVAE
jgi:membrane fusion protein, multidrug efflux system